MDRHFLLSTNLQINTNRNFAHQFKNLKRYRAAVNGSATTGRKDAHFLSSKMNCVLVVIILYNHKVEDY